MDFSKIKDTVFAEVFCGKNVCFRNNFFVRMYSCPRSVFVGNVDFAELQNP